MKIFSQEKGASAVGGSNLTISSSNPYIDLIDTDDPGNKARLSRSDTDKEFKITNDVLVPADSNAIQLNGSDEYVDFGSIAGFERTDEFSLKVWYKTSATGGAMCIIGKRDGDATARGYSVRIRPNQSKFIVMICNTDGTNELQVDFGYTGSTFHDGNWHHLVVTYDGSSNATGIKLYADNSEITGSSVGQSSITGTIINTSNFQIGRENATAGQYFNGSIDESTVYTKVLSTSERSADYNSGSGRYGLSTDDGLYAGWHFDESTGTTAEDYSDNNRDGTGVNTDDSNWISGHVINSEGGTVEEITVFSSKNGTVTGEEGIIGIGEVRIIGNGMLNAKGFASKLMRVDTGAYETAQDDTEYYSPNQHGSIYGTIYRQYFTTSLPTSLTSGGNVTRVVDSLVTGTSGGVEYIGRGWANDGVSWLYVSRTVSTDNLVLNNQNFTSISGWVDYTK
jgi:hypothetical protein